MPAVKAKNEKATKAAPVKATPSTPSGRPKKGLRDSQVRMLRVLVKEKRVLSKNDLTAKAEVAPSDMTKYLGSEDAVVRKRNDERWFPSLLTLKYVKSVRGGPEDKVEGYEVTALGRQALEKFDKQAAK